MEVFIILNSNCEYSKKTHHFQRYPTKSKGMLPLTFLKVAEIWQRFQCNILKNSREIITVVTSEMGNLIYI